MKRQILCDSNFRESMISYAPLVAIGHPDGRVTIVNTAQPLRGGGFVHESYASIEEAARQRSFVRRWLEVFHD